MSSETTPKRKDAANSSGVPRGSARHRRAPMVRILLRTSRTLAASALAIGAMACEPDSGEVPLDHAAHSESVAQLLGAGTAHSPRATDVVLVHGAWADGSSWSDVIEVLQRDGFTVRAVQLREQSLVDDAAQVRHAIEQFSGRVVVAGHSYGGAVMSQATAGAAQVSALVFVAAFAPDQGESIGSVSAGHPPTAAIQHLVIDDQGNATLEPDAYARYFAADLPRPQARALAATQHPIAASILAEPAGAPGWRTIRSFYAVSADDQVIDPDLERFFAKRMGAQTIELRASHVSLVSHPRAIAELIERAAQ